MSLATPEVSGTGRNVERNSVSIHSTSRVEVVFSPPPESPGSALAGSVNLITRSAFDRSKPRFSATTCVIMRDDARDFNKTPSPHLPPALGARRPILRQRQHPTRHRRRLRQFHRLCPAQRQLGLQFDPP